MRDRAVVTGYPAARAEAPSHAGPDPDLGALLADLGRQAERLASRAVRLRPERLSGIHNPWGPGAGLVDAWAFLSLCEAAPIVGQAADVLGDNIVLWDSELVLQSRRYADFVASGREGRFWPVDPLVGAVALCPFSGETAARVVAVPGIDPTDLRSFHPDQPLYVIRYMAAGSRFRRDPGFGPNHVAAEEQVLTNFLTRPLWLVRGEDRAGNDFVTGFAPATPRWAGAPPQKG